jgi:CheY-like chemotaxis protein
MVWLA